MLLAISALKGLSIEATDGSIGSVTDVLFDDTTWKVRWLVVDTSHWLTGRTVLLHPSAIGQPASGRDVLPVRLTKAQVKASPSILSDEPVSRQMETDLYGYYGWDPLWGGGNYFGASLYGMGAYAALPHRGDGDLQEASRAGPGENGDPHLRSVTAVMGYHIQATDGPIGHIENMLVDDETWGVHYLIIDTKNWWPGQHVLISPFAVTAVSWLERDVTLNVTRDQVKASPVWDPAAIVSRLYQTQLHGYYNWPGYGW